MSINQYVQRNRVKPADAIVLNKKFFGMVDHFVIYLGIVQFQHAFVANYVGGVRIIPNEEIAKFLETYLPVKIERFPGQEIQRGEALKRAMSLVGQSAYNFIANNCEHFKNFVHYGLRKSTQVQKAGVVVALGGLGVTLVGADRKNDGMAITGIFIILIGIIIALMGSPPKDVKDDRS